MDLLYAYDIMSHEPLSRWYIACVVTELQMNLQMKNYFGSGLIVKDVQNV